MPSSNSHPVKFKIASFETDATTGVLFAADGQSQTPPHVTRVNDLLPKDGMTAIASGEVNLPTQQRSASDGTPTNPAAVRWYHQLHKQRCIKMGSAEAAKIKNAERVIFENFALLPASNPKTTSLWNAKLKPAPKSTTTKTAAASASEVIVLSDPDADTVATQGCSSHAGPHHSPPHRGVSCPPSFLTAPSAPKKARVEERKPEARTAYITVRGETSEAGNLKSMIDKASRDRSQNRASFELVLERYSPFKSKASERSTNGSVRSEVTFRWTWSRTRGWKD